MCMIGESDINEKLEKSATNLVVRFFFTFFFLDILTMVSGGAISKKKAKDVKLNVHMVRQLMGLQFPRTFSAHPVWGKGGKCGFQRDATNALDNANSNNNTSNTSNLTVIEGQFQKAYHVHDDFIVLYFYREKGKRKHMDAYHEVDNSITFIGNLTDSYDELGTIVGPDSRYKFVGAARNKNDKTGPLVCLGFLKPIDEPGKDYYRKVKIPLGRRWRKVQKVDKSRIELKNAELSEKLAKCDKKGEPPVYDNIDLANMNVDTTALTLKHFVKSDGKLWETVGEEEHWTFKLDPHWLGGPQVTFLKNTFD